MGQIKNIKLHIVTDIKTIKNMATCQMIQNIHRSAYYGDLWKLEELLKSGCSVDVPDEKGNTPLMMALMGPTRKKKKGETIDFLLSSGADVNAVNHNVDSPLHVAVNASMRQV